MTKDSIWRALASFFLFLLLSLLLILGENFKLWGSVRELVGIVTKPGKHGLYRAGQKIQEEAAFLGFWRDGQEKIRKLEEEVVSLTQEAQRARQLREENKILRVQLEAPFPREKKLIPAKIIGFSRFLTLDQGEKQGIKVGQAVILENIYVGKVAAVSPGQAQVETPWDPDSKIPIKTEGGARGILVGQFGQSASLEKVTQEETLEVKELVFTSGEDYPQGLLVGKIEQLEKDETQVFQKVQVNPLVDFKKLKIVFVIDEK